MNVYNKIVDLFIKLTKGESIAMIGPPFYYYHADEINTDIIIQDVHNSDIKSAYPTCCKILFGKDNDFVKQIFSKTDKKDRNIFIATSLKDYERQTGVNYINEITLMSKLLIFCYVFTFYNNISILEYAKDGMHIAGNKNEEFNKDQLEFIEIMKEYEIQYHDDPIDLYLRFNKTSIYKTEKEIIIKGKYKDLPKCIFDIIQKFFEGHFYNYQLLSIIQENYSEIMFNIVYNSNIKDYVDYLYTFENNKYLNSQGDLVPNISEINPKAYLFNIIYPILNLFRIYNNQK